MNNFNCIERSEFIRDEYKEYLRASFNFGTGKLQKMFVEQLQNEELFKGPYVSMDLPFKRGDNLNGLIANGIVCSSFAKLGNIDLERPLYSHQESAIKRIAKGRGAIVTTGTGSGKTECFLYPILNEILKDYENGIREIGIRAIFLYPMNALVNDQMDRIRKILATFPEITFGFFTGDTPEDGGERRRKKYAEDHKDDDDVISRKILDNELITREEIRENPPHLLFTNYSMLEYLMIRPHDYKLFQSDFIGNWKYVVLDEAHTYTGALGIEISMLMRRLTANAEKKPHFILTSATLGKQGESEKDIVSFAHNLTSEDFIEDDIIFSKRIYMPADVFEYQVAGGDYLELIRNIKDTEKVKSICRKYTAIYENEVPENIYELLSRDSNVYLLYNELIGGSKTFNALYGRFSEILKKEELLALIDLVNQSSQNGIDLFNLKYHSFVRPLNGAFVSLGKNSELTLTKTETLNDLKAFEVGKCKYCNATYIIGSVEDDFETGKKYLRQNHNIDLYENYGETTFSQLDFFLMNDNEMEDVEEGSVEENTVCAKCGCIYPTANLNAKKCDCGEEFGVKLYKVIDTNTAGNNIKTCPCCQHSTEKGILKRLNVGKDEGTAIISQLLYKSIGSGENKKTTKSKGKLLLGNKVNNTKVDESVKQFLVFSDSRQQASFYATFFKAAYERRLRKRIIWKEIEDRNYASISLPELASTLTSYIKEKNLFDNEYGSLKNSWITILVELLDVDGQYSAEGLGLFHFEIDLSDIMSQLDEDNVREFVGKYNISMKDFENLIQMIFWGFRTIPAIRYTESTLLPEEKQEELEYRGYDNYVALKLEKTKSGVKSFLPINGDNKVVRYVMKVCNCSEGDAKSLIGLIFENIGIDGEILRKHEEAEQYQIEAKKYILKNYKNSKYYRCSKCGKITPFNIHDICVKDRCDGKLIEIDPDIEMADNYYRREYKTMDIERMVIKEHTAQIDRKEGKVFQDDFKNKKINILSCSTTFEMGIDIGGLENVFMRNVPPTPANYVQRAGRAGRRKDSSAYVLTYCSTGSHDYTYFEEPTKMISGIIKPPYFNVLNKKIIMRHLMATSLGFFFRKHQEYFKNLDNLIFDNGMEEFKKYMESKPADLIDFIDSKVIPESVYDDYHNLRWYDDLSEEDSFMEFFEDSIRQTVNEFEKAQEAAVKANNFKDADYYKNQIDRLKKQNVISELSRYCVIPKYGFPVDSVELEIYENGVTLSDRRNKEGKLNKKYNLSRDLRIAISEYAPDSEVIVDLKKFTSKYITLPKTSEFPRQWFCKCGVCHRMNIYLSDVNKECRYCGNDLGGEISEYFIEPVYGFKTGITKKSTRMKPQRTYSGEVSYLGGGIKDEIKLDIPNVMSVETSSNDELLIMNKSKFGMCPVCGYSDVVKDSRPISNTIKKHKNYRQYDCNNDELRILYLGHRFKTDVARFTIYSLEQHTEKGYAVAMSFMYAFLEGISNTFNIERKDIDGIIEPNKDYGTFDVLIYDNVPGGAGHVKRLMNKNAILQALYAANGKVSQNCCDENTSCYNCLRNYNNQSYHNILKRIHAKNVISNIIAGIK